MRFLLSLLMFISISANAYIGTISEVWEPEQGEPNYLVLVDDGRIFAVSSEEINLVTILQQAATLRQKVKLKVSKESEAVEQWQQILSVDILSNKQPLPVQEKFLEIISPMRDYSPTIVSSMGQASQYFNTMRARHRRSGQCYSRAHVWSYELDKNYGLKTKKVWLFFTKSYIRSHRYKWWFHVSPIVVVQGAAEDVVLDRKFMTKPTLLTPWKNYFVTTHNPCPVIKRYSEFSLNQYNNDCYFMFSNMYYWQPFQLEALETGGAHRTEWNSWEVKKAYRNGFSWWP